MKITKKLKYAEFEWDEEMKAFMRVMARWGVQSIDLTIYSPKCWLNILICFMSLAFFS